MRTRIKFKVSFGIDTTPCMHITDNGIVSSTLQAICRAVCMTSMMRDGMHGFDVVE